MSWAQGYPTVPQAIPRRGRTRAERNRWRRSDSIQGGNDLTYISFTLLGFESEPTQQELEAPNPKARVIRRIDRGVKFTPYEVADWAKAQGLPIHYVDGAWIRVPASRKAICAFFINNIDRDEFEKLQHHLLNRDEQWVIEAEEF